MVSSGTAAAEERAPLLPVAPEVWNEHSSSLRRFRQVLNEDVSLARTDLILLYAYLVTGLVDTSASAIWGTFVSMQTGNTVFLALGLAGPPATDGTPARWPKCLTSIISFCLGSFFFARCHHLTSPRRRWVLLFGIVVQVCCILAAAVVVTLADGADAADEQLWHILVPLALMSFQSSGQAVVSRTLRHRTLTSVALTSLYCDFFSDDQLLTGIGKNVERTRRIAAITLLFTGALAGGAWSRFGIGMTGALWTAAAMKTLYIPVWLYWPADERDEDQQSDAGRSSVH